MLVHANELAALSATLDELATETRQNPAPTAAKPSRNAKHAKAAEPASSVSAAPLPLLLPDRGYNEASFTVFDYVLEPSDLNWLSWTEFALRGDRRNTQSPSNRDASVLSSKQGAADRTKGGRLAADGKKVRPTLLDPLPFILSPHYAQIQFFMALHTRARNPFLLVGGGGTGKSSAAAQFMRQGVDSSVRRRQLTLSYATTTTTLQNLVCNVLDRHGAASFGPRLGESFALLYVDDAHLPAVGVWGDQPTSELLRFMIEDGSVFQLLGHNTIESATIVNTMFAAAITESDAGVHTIPLRLRRHFAAIRVSEPDIATIENIYTSIVSRHFSAANGFSAQIAESSKSIGPAMCQLWRFAKQQFVRTPKAFHYVFSMTDLTRMANGLLLARPLAVNTIESLYQLVLNEAQRTMSDKLISDNEITTFATHARKVVHETLQPSASVTGDQQATMVVWTAIASEQTGADLLSNASLSGDEASSAFAASGTIRASLATTELKDDTDDPKASLVGIYRPMPLATVIKTVENSLAKYNDSHRLNRIDLVWSDFFTDYLVRVCRCLSARRGNAMLVGVGGSGKQSLVKVAAMMLGHRLIQFKLGGTEAVEDTREGFRAAALGSPVTFLLSDNDRHESSTLDVVSSLMAPGELPSVFAKDELDQLLEELRLCYGVREGTAMTQVYTEVVRDHIHVALCFTPTDMDALRERVRRFPGFVQSCTVVWFPAWPMTALSRTAEALLGDAPVNNTAGAARAVATSPDKRKASIAHSSDVDWVPDRKLAAEARATLGTQCADVHKRVNEAYASYAARTKKAVSTTPKTYLDFVSGVNVQYERMFTDIHERHDEVVRGLVRMAAVQDGVCEHAASADGAAGGLERCSNEARRAAWRHSRKIRSGARGDERSGTGAQRSEAARERDSARKAGGRRGASTRSACSRGSRRGTPHDQVGRHQCREEVHDAAADGPSHSRRRAHHPVASGRYTSASGSRPVREEDHPAQLG
jgi:dynein heavy chain